MTTNPLLEIIRDEIKDNGPLRFKRFMELALYHPKFGFYNQCVSIGERKSDFTTQPEEYSPYYGKAFGGLISYLAASFPCGDFPEELEIQEHGAGNGTLARDILDFFQQEKPSLYERVKYHIREISPRLQQFQTENLSRHRNVEITPGSAVAAELSPINGFIISNELPDAFPVDLVVRKNNNLFIVEIVEKSERLFSVCQRLAGDEEIEYLEKGQYSPFPERINSQDPAEIYRKAVPINLDMLAWHQKLCRSLSRGAILTTDYGQTNGQEIMARASEISDLPIRTFQRGQWVIKGWGAGRNPLTNIGRKDITSDVNFHLLDENGKSLGIDRTFLIPEEDIYLGFSGRSRLRDRWGSWRDYEGSGFYTLLQMKGLNKECMLPGRLWIYNEKDFK